MKNLVSIVIPIYEEKPNNLEEISLLQCIRIFNKYKVTFVCPDTLNISWYLDSVGQNSNVHFEKFTQNYFNDINGYNRLLLSSFFYERFLNFDFILIYQLDSYVFKDDLVHWCEKNYDYVGAPWIGVDWFKPTKRKIFYSILKEYTLSKKIIFVMKYFFSGKLNVGNGGFSLRKVESFYKISLMKFEDFKSGNEDSFWAIYVPLISHFKIPDEKIALTFSFDRFPAKLYNLSNRKLPFGCHAWNRNDMVYQGNYDFWKKIV